MAMREANSFMRRRSSSSHFSYRKATIAAPIKTQSHEDTKGEYEGGVFGFGPLLGEARDGGTALHEDVLELEDQAGPRVLHRRRQLVRRDLDGVEDLDDFVQVVAVADFGEDR